MDLETLGFDANYSVARWLPPAGGNRVYQFGASDETSNATAPIAHAAPPHLVLAVEPANCDQWIGIFGCGTGGRTTGAFATPDPDTLAVVVRGRGFWVPVQSPAAFDVIHPSTIQQILRAPERLVLIFVGHTRLSAYGPKGLLWFTDELSWDGLEIESIDSQAVCGQAWDSPAGRNVPFRVYLANGGCEGGAAPNMRAKRARAGQEG